MKNTMKKSLFSRVALLATLISITGIANGAENEATMQDFGTFVYAVERNFTDFFSTTNKTPFATCITALEKLFTDFKKKIEVTISRSTSNGLTKEINDLIDYALHHFNSACTIMKKYNGKPSSEAANFGTEFKRSFNTEKVFGEIIAKLKVLKCKATEAGETDLCKKIETVTTMIEKKRKEWNGKSELALFAGLSHRMGCK